MAGLFGAIASGVGVAQALHGIMKSRNLVQDEELQAMMNRLSNVRVSIDSNRAYGEQKMSIAPSGQSCKLRTIPCKSIRSWVTILCRLR